MLITLAEHWRKTPPNHTKKNDEDLNVLPQEALHQHYAQIY